MKVRLGLGLALCAAAVLPLAGNAQQSAAPLPIDFGVSVGDGVRNASASKMMWNRSFYGDRLSINWGLRANLVWGDGVRHLGVGDERDSLFISNMQMLSGNAMIGVGVRVSSTIEIGANVDLVGLTLGTERNGVLSTPGGVRGASVAPVWLNGFGFGSDRTRGTLNSEAYLMYRVADEWKLRLGFSNLWTDYSIQNPQIGIPQRFRSTLPTVLVGMRYTPKE